MTQDASMIDLSVILEEAERFERGEATDDEIAALLRAGSSPGGARPKALVCDEATGVQYLAKFPSVKDAVNVVRIEAASLSLARKAGLVVPDTVLSPCGDRDVLIEAATAILGDNTKLARQVGMYFCHKYSGKRLREIGEQFGVGETAISEARRLLARKMKLDQRLSEDVERVKSILII